MLLRLLVVVALGAAVLVVARAYLAARRSEATASLESLALPPLDHDVTGGRRTWIVFTTPYCATCGPVKQRIAAFDPGTPIVEVDVASRPDLAHRYRVRTAPTVLLAGRGGAVEARFVGNVAEAELAAVGA